jgi:hypothetical protein
MEIAPASVDDVRLGRDGKRYLVTAEAGSIARQLQEIDPRVYVEFHEPPAGQEANPYYSVCLRVDDDQSDLIFRTSSLDGRVVERMRMLNFNMRHGITEADRMDAEDEARRAKAEYQRSQEIKANAYPLMRAIQKSVLGINPRVSMHRSKAERRAG